MMRPTDPTTPHPLDAATALEPSGDGALRGSTSPHYANMTGPFGGWTAAVLLRAALDDPRRLGDPVALTVNFCAPVADGGFEMIVRESRRNRSTQHWSVEMAQGGDTVATATAVFAVRRPTWNHLRATPPDAPPFDALARRDSGKGWVERYDMRFAHGAPVWRDSATPHDEPGEIRTVLWLRDDPPRSLDYVSLTATSDAFFGRILHARGVFAPFGTVTLSTYFHADAAALAEVGDDPLLGVADARVFDSGFADQSAELWWRGRLLATSHQMVYYRDPPAA